MTPENKPLSPIEAFAKAYAADRAGQPAVADQLYRALEAGRLFTAAARELSYAFALTGRYAEAEAVVRTALRRQPENDELREQLAYLRLMAGDYAEGLALFEHRRMLPPANGARRPPFRFPEWRGERVGSLVVIGEQGLGDQIQFARFIPQLARSAERLTFYCDRRLARLFAPFGVEIIPVDQNYSVGPADAWLMLMSAPERLGVQAETIPGAPYLPSKPGGTGIGLVTAGSPEHARDRERSLPADIAAELRRWPGMVSLDPRDTGAADFEDTRRIIADLELVITVDTAVAHLAGAMGKPVWILLPFLPDWRWRLNRPDTPWYPSARLFRQAAPDDWDPVIAQVRAALSTLAGGRTRRPSA